MRTEIAMALSCALRSIYIFGIQIRVKKRECIHLTIIIIIVPNNGKCRFFYEKFCFVLNIWALGMLFIIFMVAEYASMFVNVH